MNLLVIESAIDQRRLMARLAAATRQESEDLTLLLITREATAPHARVIKSAECAKQHAFKVMQLRDDDGLGSVLRLVRKRYKQAAKIAFCFDDEVLIHPQALRRMFAAVDTTTVLATCGFLARDDSAQRNGEVGVGALPTVLAERIDGLAVAELDALDSIQTAESDGRARRRRVLAETLARDAESVFINELLVRRDIASIHVAYASAAAPVCYVTASGSTTSAAKPSERSAKQERAKSRPKEPQGFDDEPLLANAFRQDFTTSSIHDVDDDVSAILEALTTDEAHVALPPVVTPSLQHDDEVLEADGTGANDEQRSSVTFAPGLTLDADTTFVSASLDDDAKALLTELASEGRLDLEELEASLDDNDSDAILFVSKLPELPDEFRQRMRAKFIAACGDPALVEKRREKQTKNGGLSIDDLGGSDLDADTRAILEAAIEGPPDLSWLEEDIDSADKATAVAEADDDYAVDEALERLKSIDRKLADEATPPEDEDERPSALDGWFEDFEREEDDKTPKSNELSGGGPQRIDIEPESAGAVLAWQATSGFDAVRARAREIASQIAESLVVLQQPSGDFLEAERYAKECAAALWHGLDRQLYRVPIQKALDAAQRRAEALTLQSKNDGQAPMRVYALGTMGRSDASRQPLDPKLCIDTLVEAIVCSRRGQVFDFKRVNMVCRALDESGALFDRWAPEDPDATVLSARDQAFATLLTSELAMRNPDRASIVAFSRKLEDRLLVLARSNSGCGMFTAATAYRCADRRDDGELMRLIIDRFANATWEGSDRSTAESHSESLAFLGLHLAFDPATEATETAQ